MEKRFNSLSLNLQKIQEQYATEYTLSFKGQGTTGSDTDSFDSVSLIQVSRCNNLALLLVDSIESNDKYLSIIVEGIQSACSNKKTATSYSTIKERRVQVYMGQ